jgi:hypothetical protein
MPGRQTLKRAVPPTVLAVAALPALAVQAGCARRDDDQAVAWIVLDQGEGEQATAEATGAPRVTPAAALVRSVRTGPKVTLGIDPEAARSGVRVELPGGCPVQVAASELAGGRTVRRTVLPRMTLQAPAHPQDLGYDAPFVVEAALACDAPALGSFAWRQLGGPALSDVHVEGSRLHARTAPADPLDRAERPAWGIVPVSARATGNVEIEATWRPQSGDEASVSVTMTVAAASRSHGLPNVALDEGILLAGAGWTLESAPRGARQILRPSGDLSSLVPDASGTWLLHDGQGHRLSLHAGRYDETPLDCGRATCHGAIASAARTTPMTLALLRLGPSSRPCAAGCHATGEEHGHDGGFADLARELGLAVGERGWDELPSAMHRVAGVTCLACHGPGAIPEASARWAILRSDVCATCHDAPPTYGHVAAWRASRMARADADRRTRRPACARCHTTSGFLASQRGATDDRTLPPELPGSGIACAACHAPHESDAPAPSLVRHVRPVAGGVASGQASAVCLPCHAPSPDADATHPPPASAAALWAGSGGLDPRTGAPLSGPAVHAAALAGCTGCHHDGPTDLERGRSHAFRSDPAVCAGCHAGTVPDMPTLAQALRSDALSLLAALEARGAIARDLPFPAHAQGFRLTDDALGRAAYDVLLVLEDPAAAAHNAPFARALLGAAAKVLGGEASRR